MKILCTANIPGIEKVRDFIGGNELVIEEDREAAMIAMPEIEVLFTAYFDKAVLDAAKKLRWVQVLAGGVDLMVFDEFIRTDILMTCLKGCFTSAGAEFAIAAMLMFNYNLQKYTKSTQKGECTFIEPNEFRGKTVGILGLGEIGMETARLASALGARVIGTKRDVVDIPSFVDKCYRPSDMDEVLHESDFVVVSLPRTKETVGIIDAHVFQTMKESAFLIDISGRRVLFDEQAMYEALKERKIAGAFYQMQQEPTKISNLWELENIIVSKASANSVQEYESVIKQLCYNMQAYLNKEPLKGLVDKIKTY